LPSPNASVETRTISSNVQELVVSIQAAMAVHVDTEEEEFY